MAMLGLFAKPTARRTALQLQVGAYNSGEDREGRVGQRIPDAFESLILKILQVPGGEIGHAVGAEGGGMGYAGFLEGAEERRDFR